MNVLDEKKEKIIFLLHFYLQSVLASRIRYMADLTRQLQCSYVKITG